MKKLSKNDMKEIHGGHCNEVCQCIIILLEVTDDVDFAFDLCRQMYD